MWAYVGFKTVKLNKTLVLATIFYTITVVGFVASNKMTTAANAILLQYIAPVWVAILSRIFLKDKLRLSDFVSIFILLIGLSLFFLEKLEIGMMLGNIIALITSFSFASFFIAVKSLKKEETIYPIIYGNALTFVIGIPFYSMIMVNTKSISSLLVLGIIQIGLAYILYSKSMVYLRALDAILIPMIEPLLNPVWVFIFIGEVPSLLSFIGGMIVLISVVGRSYYQQKRPVSKRDSSIESSVA